MARPRAGREPFATPARTDTCAHAPLLCGCPAQRFRGGLVGDGRHRFWRPRPRSSSGSRSAGRAAQARRAGDQASWARRCLLRLLGRCATWISTTPFNKFEPDWMADLASVSLTRRPPASPALCATRLRHDLNCPVARAASCPGFTEMAKSSAGARHSEQRSVASTVLNAGAVCDLSRHRRARARHAFQPGMGRWRAHAWFRPALRNHPDLRRWALVLRWFRRPSP